MKLKNLSNEEFLSKLNELKACGQAINWVKEKSFDLKQTWNTCERYSWLYWLANEMGVDHKAIVSSACQNVRLVMKFLKKGEKEPFKSIETVEKWCNGDTSITTKILKDDAAYAIHAAYAVACCAAADAAYDAAYVAAYAAFVADAAFASNAYAEKQKIKDQILINIRNLIEIED
jgi:hypothetical protein